MTVRFGNNRLAFYIVTFILSAVVLGLAANFANEFLPHFHPNFIVFALIVSSLQIFVFLLTLQWATPRTEVITVFIMGVLWLAMGAWATDVIGPTQCDGLGGQTTPAKNGDISAQGFCYEMKVIQAFSWALFSIFVIAFWILLQLISQAERFGRYRIWSEPIRELPWFGEMPGYYNANTYEPGMAQYQPGSAGVQYGYPGQYGAGMPAPAPGHSIIIQPGMNGAPPTVTQVPMSAV
ncbi:hypothetical protein D9613_005066 [Agrocybe pediades]|uniref:MARVEL domain-containing protein n=1 Tax=Agrocybe pediades TaxID=84607 RepID=A0A8H4QYS9_9AGAR|nr:hypothetical protein D9613_005066 [Agrocybe pediades]KAF9568888.1 hypothetical protein CPC08DRAFT_702006 [Agrocybe pediades]